MIPLSRSVASPRARRANAWLTTGIAVCVIWSVGAAYWPGLRLGSNLSSLLSTVATISSAGIALTVTAGLLSVQLLSRFGARASRMAIDRTIAALIALAALVGVAAPLWAAAEPWSWLRVAGFAGFAWAILALASAISMTLMRLDGPWLVSRTMRSVLTGRQEPPEQLMGRLADAQSALFDIAGASRDGDPAIHAAARAIALTDFLRSCIDPGRTDVPGVIRSLSTFARSPGISPNSAAAVAGAVVLLAAACADPDATSEAVIALHELIEAAIAHGETPLARDLLAETSGLLSERLERLLDPCAFGWLLAQQPIERSRSHDVVLSVVATEPAGSAKSGLPSMPALTSELDPIPWLDHDAPPQRGDLPVLRAAMRRLGIGSPEPAGEARAEDAGSHTFQASERSRLADRSSEAYDLLEAWAVLARATCASPAPDDGTWPGGWRGIDEFSRDVRRLASVAAALYEGTRYPPADRVERAIESLAVHCLSSPDAPTGPDDPPDATGWRLPETLLRHSTVHPATEALATLATDAWGQGFDRRALITLRRLTSVLARAVRDSDARTADDIAEDLTRAAMDAAKWSGETLAARARARRLVLALAPEMQSLAHLAQRRDDDDLWRRVFHTMDTVAWAPDAYGPETAAAASLYLISGASDLPDPRGGSGLRPERPRSPLSPAVRERLLDQLQWLAPRGSPAGAMACVLALWSDAIVTESEATCRRLVSELDANILSYPREAFALPELWKSAEPHEDRPPSPPTVHVRLFNVATTVRAWLQDRLAGGNTLPEILPDLDTPDASLRTLVEQFGAACLFDERHYWGVSSTQECFVFVQEADRSRRLLRDHELRARGIFAWGYGGTGPHTLGQALVEDVLESLVNCPSCLGMIGVAGPMISCPLCGDGLRGELSELETACADIICALPRSPDRLLAGEGVPDDAEWHLTRTGLLTALCDFRA